MHVLQQTTPKIIFCSKKSVDVVLSALKKKNYDSTVVTFEPVEHTLSFSDILNNCNDVEIANFHYVELDNIKKTGCILHSSGTTGMPKGVELSNHVLLNMSQEKCIDMNNTPSLWFSPLYWLSGVLMNLFAILQSSKVILYPEFDEEMICRLIEKYKVILHYI